jgi:hypothetical protein
MVWYVGEMHIWAETSGQGIIGQRLEENVFKGKAYKGNTSNGKSCYGKTGTIMACIDKACNGNACNCMKCKGNVFLDRNVRARHHRARHSRTMYLRPYPRSKFVLVRHAKFRLLMFRHVMVKCMLWCGM